MDVTGAQPETPCRQKRTRTSGQWHTFYLTVFTVLANRKTLLELGCLELLFNRHVKMDNSLYRAAMIVGNLRHGTVIPLEIGAVT